MNRALCLKQADRIDFLYKLAGIFRDVIASHGYHLKRIVPVLNDFPENAGHALTDKAGIGSEDKVYTKAIRQ